MNLRTMSRMYFPFEWPDVSNRCCRADPIDVTTTSWDKAESEIGNQAGAASGQSLSVCSPQGSRAKMRSTMGRKRSIGRVS